jgi:AraC family transcriptional regulator
VIEGNLVLRSLDGASIRRVIDRSRACVPEHAHDWPVLSLFVIGSYLNETEAGERFISGPSAVFYRAGARHRNTTAAVGFEQIEIEFDPSWLGERLLPRQPVTRWLGGRVAREARSLAYACQTVVDEDRLRAALRQFLAGAPRSAEQEVEQEVEYVEHQAVSWIGNLARRLREDASLKVSDLATEIRRHPSWVGSAYRHATGEGLQETAARLRVERATLLLRESSQPLSAIAFEAGFCDQSHMNRTFRRVLGRSPVAVREERRDFRQAEEVRRGPLSAGAGAISGWSFNAGARCPRGQCDDRATCAAAPCRGARSDATTPPARVDPPAQTAHRRGSRECPRSDERPSDRT